MDKEQYKEDYQMQEASLEMLKRCPNMETREDETLAG